MKKKSNQRGIVTLSFLFVFALLLSLLSMFFLFCLSLAAMELAQYAAYSTSRTYSSANVNASAQTELAEKKFKDIKEKISIFKSETWFTLSDPHIGHTNDSSLGSAPPNDNSFYGVTLTLSLRLLQRAVPFVGGIFASEAPVLTLGSYLGQEVNQDTCHLFADRRKTFINSAVPKDNPYKEKITQGNKKHLISISDNGC